MAIFIKHTGCSKCGSSDALAHYSDGGSYCFSCGFSSRASVPSFTIEEEDEEIKLPLDLNYDFPEEMFKWIGPTGLTIEELIKHGYFFSNSTRKCFRLLFQRDDKGIFERLRRSPGAAEDRHLYRVYGSGPKTKFYGNKETTFAYSYKSTPIYGALQPSEYPFSSQENGSEEAKTRVYGHNQLVVVEDSLSSIKVGRITCSLPLFGSTISNNKLAIAIKPFDEIVFWLDSDKLNNAKNMADRAQLLGKKTRVIYTELDPKYLNPEEFL